MNTLTKLAVEYLRDAADKIERGKCDISKEQIKQVIDIFGQEPLSKYEAYKFLGISRSKFDYLLRIGRLPQGKKRIGFKELVWYASELEEYKQKIQEKDDLYRIK